VNFTVNIEYYPPTDGVLRYARIPWDSRIYGFPIFELQSPDAVTPEELASYLPGLLDQWSAIPGKLLVFSKIKFDAVRTSEILAANGFYPVEAMLELFLPLSRFSQVIQLSPLGLIMRSATTADVPRLKALATSAFHSDRLHLDTHLPPKKADERFALWVQNGVESGEPVFCFDMRGKTVGFSHVRPDSSGKIVDISLAAMDASCQGLGLGLLMYHAVIEELKSRSFRIAETHVSVNNPEVINLFIRLGFAVRKTVLTFHRYKE